MKQVITGFYELNDEIVLIWKESGVNIIEDLIFNDYEHLIPAETVFQLKPVTGAGLLREDGSYNDIDSDFIMNALRGFDLVMFIVAKEDVLV